MTDNQNTPLSARLSWLATTPWSMWGLLLVGLLVRISLIGSAGFATDISTFESWSLKLAEGGLGNFYSHSSYFLDYPPGYCYVLAFIGAIWEGVFRAVDPRYAVLAVLVKIPAIVADLGIGALLYSVALRFSGRAIALATAAMYILNPCVIEISAVYGQVDAVSGGFAFLAAFFLLKSMDTDDRSFQYIVAAWASLSYSLLIKPQAAVLIAVFLAFAFQDRTAMRKRVVATLGGVLTALITAILLTEPFHPSNPIECVHWLLTRYAYGSNVYPFNSVNAFNLWAITGQMWQPDGGYILFLPMKIWGILLVLLAMIAVLWRYMLTPSNQSFLQACALSTICFFALATRMHERYLFDGVLFCVASVPFGVRYIYASLALSSVLFANLTYAIQYLGLFTNPVAGVDTHNIWGAWTSLYSTVAVAMLLMLLVIFVGYPNLLATSGGNNTTHKNIALL